MPGINTTQTVQQHFGAEIACIWVIYEQPIQKRLIKHIQSPIGSVARGINYFLVEAHHHPTAIDFNNAAAAWPGGCEGEHREQAARSPAGMCSQQLAQISLAEIVCMDQQASAARKESSISQQAACGTQQAGLMASFQPHRALLPATQKILHLISQVVGIHQGRFSAEQLKLLQPMGQ